MIIPVKVIYTGDEEAAKALHGHGRRAMFVLDNVMALRGLKQHSITFNPIPGALIKCTNIFGTRTMEIIAGSWGEIRELLVKECQCYPNFAFAIIEKVYPETPTDNDLLYARFKYDVIACAGGSTYIPVADVASGNYERYEIGQFVLITFGTEVDFTASCERACLFEGEQPAYFAVSPFYATDGMDEWKEETQKFRRVSEAGWERYQ